ncbi:MAG: hypothetical protein SFY80_10625 [Verrucomicrobiota bacterium]|nr:hypothetical protein [Verrucomicrobiota bacterium]
MNINTNKDLMPIMTAFCGHFGTVSNDRGVEHPVLLNGHYTQADLEADRVAFGELLFQFDAVDAELRHAYAVRDEVKAIVVQNAAGFINSMKFHADALGQGGKLPKAPRNSTKQLDLLQLCNTIIGIWTSVDESGSGSLTLPFTVRNGYNRTQFIANTAALTAAYNTIIEKKRESATVRHNRDILRDRVRARLVEYRVIIRVLYPADHLFVRTLPKLNKGDGPAAEAVEMSATWNDATKMAVLNWTANTQPELKHYEIRACREGKYQSQNDHVIGTVAKDKLTFQTNEGLVAEGSQIHLKVYAVTQGGRERGSNSVKVVRTTPVSLTHAA